MDVSRSRHSRPSTLSRIRALPLLPSLMMLAAGLALIVRLDHRTGEAPVQHLYYIPLVFAAIRFGAGGGMLAALGAIFLYHFANSRLLSAAYGHADILQILMFVAFPLITAKLADDARRLRQLASTDDLTGLSNLRGFEDRLERLIGQTRAQAGALSMLVVDVDRLKSLNDVYGHLTGADAVRTVGRILGESLPPEAAACRYGGDEFAIAVPCGAAEARLLAETLVRRVRQTAPVLAGRLMAAGTLSISVGVASRQGQDLDDGEALFRAADKALYAAKESGRDRTAVAR